MTGHEQPATGVALKPCPGFNPDLSSRGEGDCLNCGRHQSEHGAPTDAGGAVSEALRTDLQDRLKLAKSLNAEATFELDQAQIETVLAALSSPQPLQQGGEVTE